MRADASTPLAPDFCIGSDGSRARLTQAPCARLTQFTTTSVRGRDWLDSAGGAVEVQLPLSGAPALWTIERVSRDQVDLACRPTDADGAPILVARQTVTADAWGLHLALAVERCHGRVAPLPFGFVLSLAASATAALAVPSGTLGGGTEGRSPDAPFGWPRRSILTHSNGDRLEVCAYAPLSRIEVRRRAQGVQLRLLSPSAVQVGETARLECRLAACLARD